MLDLNYHGFKRATTVFKSREVRASCIELHEEIEHKLRCRKNALFSASLGTKLRIDNSGSAYLQMKKLLLFSIQNDHHMRDRVRLQNAHVQFVQFCKKRRFI